MTKAAKCFSAVIPTLNEEKNIAATLDALKASGACLELIVADGRSKDDTIRIAIKNGAKVVFEKQGFRSIGAGRNRGAKEAKSGLLLFNDADTIVDKGFFAEAEKAFRNPEVVCVGCKVMPRGVDALTRFFFEFLNLFIWGSVVLGRPAIAGNCVAYRAKAFWKVKGFDEFMQASEDQDLCERISKLGKVVYLSKTTAWTSPRRIKAMGVIGLLFDWGKTTLNFLAGRKNERYAIVREV